MSETECEAAESLARYEQVKEHGNYRRRRYFSCASRLASLHLLPAAPETWQVTMDGVMLKAQYRSGRKGGGKGSGGSKAILTLATTVLLQF